MYEDTVLEYNNYLCTFVLVLFVVVSCLFWHLVDGGIVGGTVGFFKKKKKKEPALLCLAANNVPTVVGSNKKGPC